MGHASRSKLELRPRHPAINAIVLLVLSACGARTPLRSDGHGSGGATSSTTTTSTASTTTTSTNVGGSGGSPVVCDQFAPFDPIVVGDAGSPSAGIAPEILPSADGKLDHFSLEGPGGFGTLVWRSLDVFDQWPPVVVDKTSNLALSVEDYRIGAGPSGPVGLLQLGTPNGGSQVSLATRLLPAPEVVQVSGPGPNGPLFVAGRTDSYLAATGAHYGIGEYHAGVESYQPGSLTQNEPPAACMSSPVHGGATPTPEGFLTAISLPNPPELANCSNAPFASIVSVGHYDVSPNEGPALHFDQGAQYVTGDRVEHVSIAPTSFGAWVTYQTAGLDAEQPPPAYAFQVDGKGNFYPDVTNPIEIAVTENGTFEDLTTATLGDALVVAWVDVTDPSAPTIIVQLVRPDLSYGPSLALPTNANWFTGRLRMVGSLDGRSLILSWESQQNGLFDRVLDRIDCTPEL